MGTSLSNGIDTYKALKDLHGLFFLFLMTVMRCFPYKSGFSGYFSCYDCEWTNHGLSCHYGQPAMHQGRRAAHSDVADRN